jgi:multidrug efflux pump subunit AcrA (membrane-fusion protein)
MIQLLSNTMARTNGQASVDGRSETASSPPSRRKLSRSTWRMLYSSIALSGVIAMILATRIMQDALSSTTEANLSAKAVPVDVFQPIEDGSYQVARGYTGTIVARRKSDLGFELPGKLVQVLFDAGDHVDAGALLARLDTEHLTKKREELIARQAQAQAVFDELTAGPRKEAIAFAQAKVHQLASQLELLEIQHARQKRLLQQNAVSREEYDISYYSLAARKADHAAAEHKLEELKNGTRPEQIAAQQAVLNQLTAQIADVDVELKKSSLHAPFAGKVAARIMDEGKVVQAGTSVVQLLEADALEAWIGVPPQETTRLNVGEERSITIEGAQYKARVARVLPNVDPDTQTQTVILDLLESASQFVADGQVVRLELNTQVDEQGMWVPTTALEKSSHGLWSCYALENSEHGAEAFRIERRYVELLHSDGARAYVRGTIAPGEKIVSGGTHRNVPGQLVRLGKDT